MTGPDNLVGSHPPSEGWKQLTAEMAAEYPAATPAEVSQALAEAFEVVRLFAVARDTDRLVRLTARHALDEASHSKP